MEGWFQVVVCCPTCGGEHKIMGADGGQCTKEALCCNCGGRHSAAYNGCPRYSERQEQIQIIVDKNIF